MSAFAPNSIAVIGASASEHKVGHMVLRNLLEQGFTGKVYPVNPKGGEILGQKVYTSVNDIEDTVDLALVITPAPTVPGVAEECGEKGVPWLAVISAGFSEVHTDEGEQLENELVGICNRHDMKLIGPNCLGVLQPGRRMNASFAKDLPAAGNTALISQSGAMAVAIMDASPALHVGYSLIFSIGNKGQLNECDFLELCEQDDDTDVIGMYLESITDGRRFLEVAGRVAQHKKIVLLKSGVSEHGKEAASSHTGALAGSDAAIDAACAQAGVERAHDTQEFLRLLRTFSTQPPLLTNRIGIVTNAGGPGILATDAAEAAGLSLPTLSDATLNRLQSALPAAAGLVNPVDVVGDATTDRYEVALDAFGQDPNIDGLVVLLTPQVMTPCDEIAKAIIEAARIHPLMPVTAAFMGETSVHSAKDTLAKHGIPVFSTPEQAVKAMAGLQESGKKDTGSGKPNPQAADRKPQTGTLLQTTGLLDQSAAKELLNLYDIETPQQALAASANEAVQLAEDIGYPVIAKISSPQIIHKTDVGGIRANLKTADDVRAAYEDIWNNVTAKQPEADIKGVLIQKFLPLGNEFIIGGVRDPSFGPMVMVGLGGIYTELFHDTSFRIAPITAEEGYRMLQELRSWQLLMGMRGANRSDIDELVRILAAVSQLMHDCPAVTELDFNPILVHENGVIIADAKIVLGAPPQPYKSH